MAIDFALLKQQNLIPDYLRRHGIRMEGKKFSCVAPDHKDNDPSASIHSNDEKWKCHHCDIGGDVIDLEMLRTGCTKIEAIKSLGGEQWSTEMPQQPPPKRGTKPVLVREIGAIPEGTPPLKPGKLTLWKADGSETYQTSVDILYEYRDAAGALQGYVGRKNAYNGKSKKIFPIRWHVGRQGFAGAGWHSGEHRPLFNEHLLAQRPKAEVLVVEGEKCAVVAQAMFPDMVVTTWIGGHAQRKDADFSALKDRHVTLWADKDEPGRECMDVVAAKAGAAVLLTVPMQEAWPDKADLADLMTVSGAVEAALSTRKPYRFDLSPKGYAGKWAKVEDGGWLPDGAVVIRQPNGTVSITHPANGMHALKHHPAFQSLSYDIMRRELRWQGRTLPDEDIYLIQTYLHDQVGLNITHGFETMLVNAALARKINPLADGMQRLQWDGQHRVRALPGYFGVEDTPWAIAAFLRWFLGHVQRILEPGSKQDLILILEGEQGIGKSTALKILGQAFDCNGYARIASMGAGRMNDNEWMMVAGKTIVELGELTAVRRADLEHFKDVVTRDIDEYRVPYARTISAVKRTCSFVGTTNLMHDYLVDPTGNRRFAPVTCVDEPDLDRLEADREQLYAEAAILLKTELTYFTGHEVEWQEAETAKRQNIGYTRMRLEQVMRLSDREYWPPKELENIVLADTSTGLGPSYRDSKTVFEDIKKAMLELGWSFQKQRDENGNRREGFFRNRRLRGRQPKRRLHPASKLFE